MSIHTFSVERVIITGVGYGDMGTRTEKTLVCSCGAFRRRLSDSTISDKHENLLNILTHAVAVLADQVGVTLDLVNIGSIDKGRR